MMKHLKKALAAGVSAALLASGPALAEDVDPNLPEYERVSGVSGNLSSVGSDTLNNLMTLWAEEFNRYYPNVNIQIQGAGSSTAPPALTQGTSNFGPMSRHMKSSEVQAFEEAYGYPPTPVAVAVDLLAVYVNKDNPIKGMSLPQVDAVFSSTRRCGHPEDVTRWGQLGLTGAWADRDIALYGRNSVSGTYGYFREHALCGGDYKSTVNEQPGSASVVQGVTESVNGIGYSGIGYRTSGVRAIALGKSEDALYEPTAENAANGNYPLARQLLVYTNKHPNRDLSPMEREFLKLVLSKQGQETVVKDGYVPLPESVAAQQREKVDID
nr:phosphate ABC transporter substrate-binding protein PstS family protein [Ectothiorhodospira mobilis]